MAPPPRWGMCMSPTWPHAEPRSLYGSPAQRLQLSPIAPMPRSGSFLDDDFRGRPALPAFRRAAESCRGGTSPRVRPRIRRLSRRGAHLVPRGPRARARSNWRPARGRLHSGIVWEGLGLLQWSVPDTGAAFRSFEQAENCYGKTEDGLRTVLHRVEILQGRRQIRARPPRWPERQ